MRCARRVSLVLIVTALVGWSGPTAAAADKVVLGGGAGIVIDGTSVCTLTAIGNDNQGNLIGFTSAHCGGPGAQVTAESAQGAGVLGTMVAGNDASTTPEQAMEFKAKLEEAGVDFEQHVYRGAPHSFFDRSYDEWKEACDDAWRRMLGFVKQHST